MRILSSLLLFCLLLTPGAVADDREKLLRTLQLTEFHGRVVDPSGKPLAGAGVWMFEPHPKWSWKRVASTDRDGYFLLSNAIDPESGGILRTCLDGYVQKTTYVAGVRFFKADRYGPSKGGVAKRAALPYERIRLEPVSRVSGRVVDPSGRPIANAWVWVYEGHCSHREPFPASPCPADGIDPVTDENGAFTLEPLAPGSYQLAAAARGYLSLEDQGPQVATGAEDVLLVLSPETRSEDWTDPR